MGIRINWFEILEKVIWRKIRKLEIEKVKRIIREMNRKWNRLIKNSEKVIQKKIENRKIEEN